MTKLSEKQTEEIKSLVESLFWTGMDADSFIDRIESIIYPNGEGGDDETAQDLILQKYAENYLIGVKEHKFYFLFVHEVRKCMSEYAALRTASLQSKLEEALDERETMIQAFTLIRSEFEGRSWLMDGRGSYQYNDDRYKEEVRYIMDAFSEIERKMWSQIKSKTHEYRKKIEDNYATTRRATPGEEKSEKPAEGRSRIDRCVTLLSKFGIELSEPSVLIDGIASIMAEPNASQSIAVGDEKSISVLIDMIDNLPENRPLYKDSGLWQIRSDDMEETLFQQGINESFYGFIERAFDADNSYKHAFQND